MSKKEKFKKTEEQPVVNEEPVVEAGPETELLEETKELENEIQTLTEDNKKLTEKVQLAQAELINYRRRKDEETTAKLKYANQDLITELLPIVDNFERAVNVDESKISEELKKYFVGFKMMCTNLQAVLKNYGVEEINRVGQLFDPKEEQALMTDSNPELDDDIVTEVLLKGYKLKDRVIRPASVKINQK